MHTFTQKKIALAVGATLLTMAGGAQAAVSVAERTAKPALITAVAGGAGAAGAHKLYNGTGHTGTLTVQLNFTAGASALTNNATNTESPGLDIPLITAGTDGFLVNGAAFGAGFASPGTAGTVATTDDVSIFAGSGATAIPLSVSNLGFTVNVAGATFATFAATAAMTLDANTTAASGAFRLNTAGALEWISNVANALTGTWLPVSIKVNQSTTAGGAIRAFDRITGTGSDGTAAPGYGYGAAVNLTGTTAQTTAAVGGVSGQAATVASTIAESIFSAVLPTPILATKTPATNVGLVDGVTIDTLTPLVGFAGATVVASASTTGGNACLTAITEATTTTTAVPAASTSFATVAGATTSASTYSVTLSAPTTAFSGTYTASCFNTGVTQLPVKLEFNNTAGTASNPAYSLVFNTATGVAATAADLGITAATVLVDGAAPVLTKAEYTNDASPATTAAITLTFSEPMALLSGGANGAMREIAENIKFGGDSLAALNLNAGGALTGGTVAGTPGALAVVAATGNSTLMVNGVQQADAVKAVTVSSGIALMESSDPTFATLVAGAPLAKLDNVWGSTGPNGVQLSGGLQSATGVVEGATQMTAIALPSATATAATFASETARTIPMATPNTNKIGTVVVTHGQTMNIPTAAALAGNIIVTVTGVNLGNAPAQFQFIPTAAQLTAITATGFTITLPTALVYANVDSITGVNVQYTAAGATAQVFMTAPTAPTVAAALAAGNIDAVIPFSATPLASAFTTMDLKGAVSDAAVGDAVYAYLAKWSDAPTTGRTVTIGDGKVSNNGAVDRVAMDLAIGYSATGAGQAVVLAALVKAELDAAAAAAAAVPGVSNAAAAVTAKQVPVYVQLTRSNDAVSSGGGAAAVAATAAGNLGASQQNLLAHAKLSTVSNDGTFNAYDPIYAVNVDPVTGNITGRLTGNVKINVTTPVTAGKERGLHYLDTNGALAANQAAGVFSAGVVGTAGAFEFMVGANIGGGANFNKLAGAFVVLQHVSSATGTVTELTSADPGAANFLPFTPDLSRAGIRTVLPTYVLANIRTVTMVGAGATGWQLVGLGNPSRAAGAAGNITPLSFPRMFENTVNDKGHWADHTNGVFSAVGGDLAMAIAGNKVGIATELSDGSTLSTINNVTAPVNTSNFVPASVAIAFADASSEAGSHRVYVTQGTTPAAGVKLPIGWSLVTVPGVPGAAVTTVGAGVKAVIRVGAQTGTQFTWVAADGAAALTPLVAGEAVFVYSTTLNGAL